MGLYTSSLQQGLCDSVNPNGQTFKQQIWKTTF